MPGIGRVGVGSTHDGADFVDEGAADGVEVDWMGVGVYGLVCVGHAKENPEETAVTLVGARLASALNYWHY